MAEYIERDIAAAFANNCGAVYVANRLSDSNAFPAADVVPVVRCKDCKYYRVSTMLAPNKFCFRLKHPVEDRPIGYNFAPDDFCSYGERKEND